MSELNSELNKLVQKYYDQPDVYARFIAESPVVRNGDHEIIAQGSQVPSAIVQLLEMQATMQNLMSDLDFRLSHSGRTEDTAYGLFSLKQIAVALGDRVEWLGDGGSYGLGHFRVRLHDGNYLYLRQGDARYDRECCVVDEEGFDPYIEPDKFIKFKVQIPSINGWADLKSSVDGGPYEVELYDSEGAALSEVRDELKPGEFRIVPSHTPADDDLY